MQQKRPDGAGPTALMHLHGSIGMSFFESVKIGCCGFPTKKVQYAQRFNVVEVQQTFYQPPRIATLSKWRALVPDQFEFTLKAWQLITHTAKSPTFRRLKVCLTAQELAECGSFQPTAIVKHAWDTTLACAEALAAKLVLLQCPASFGPTEQNVEQMSAFFKQIERRELTLLWEPRGDWPETLVSSLCRDLNLIHACDPFLSSSMTKEFLYFRLHGGKNFQHVFTPEELKHVAGLTLGSAHAYVMFNNIQMWNDATRFQETLDSFRKDLKGYSSNDR